MLSGIPAELPTAADEIRERGVPVSGGLSAAGISAGPVTFVVVWDENGELCEPPSSSRAGSQSPRFSAVEE